MSEPFIGQIRMFAGNFAPRGHALCQGQLLNISQNTALFSLFGTIYGGDGETTFALPDLRGRTALHKGTGPGHSTRNIGARGGTENETITASTMPAHSHTMTASELIADQGTGTGNVLASTPGPNSYDNTAAPSKTMVATSPTGGSRSHTNIMPYLCINYIVALVGIYPSRN